MTKKRSSSKKRKAPRRNPRRRTYRRAVSRARSTFAGLNIKSALKDVPLTQVGMFATKWLAKRFGPDATETDPDSWNWSSYLKGGLGAVIAGFLAQTIKPGAGQKVLAGGLNLVVYKLIQNELIADNDWAEEQFGAGQEEGYLPGDVEDDEYGNSYLLGEDEQWHQLPEAGVMGEMQRVGPLGEMGAMEKLTPPGPLGDDAVADAMLG
jgi:hypothetical protein